jgi:hypothetical protein
MVVMKRSRATLLFSYACMLSMCCSKPDVLSSVRKGDMSMVYGESYRGRLLFLGEGKEYAGAVERLRRTIDKNIDVLDTLTERLFTEPHLGYRFKYAALDADNDILLLRYFARIREHTLYAGYQVQLLFDAESFDLLRLHISEVPLE